MTTFSQLVDDVAVELVRPDLKLAIASYVNQTLRELFFKPTDQSAAFYGASRLEQEITIPSDGPYLWDIPMPQRFQKLEAAYVPQLGQYIKESNPKEVYKEGVVTDRVFTEYYWYRSGPVIGFAGMQTGWTLQLTYFEYAPRFVYKEEVDRLVTYDKETDTYTAAQPEDIDLESHWLLRRWSEEVKEGARAKTFKRVGDEGRARMAYSSYESARTMIWQMEGDDSS